MQSCKVQQRWKVKLQHPYSIMLRWWLLVTCLGACRSFQPLAGRAARFERSELSLQDARIATFERSWKASGVEATGLKHREFNYECGDVRGLGTSTRYATGQTLIALPVGGSLVALEGDPASCTVPAYSEVWKKVRRGSNRLALLLLHEWQRGDQSPLQAYIDILPPPGALGTPLHWGPLLGAFPYRQLVRDVERQRQAWGALYVLVAAAHPEGEGFGSYERFVWAMEMVASRAFQGQVPQKKDSDLGAMGMGAVGAVGKGGMGGGGLGGVVQGLSALLVPAVGVSALGLTLAAYRSSKLDDPTAAGLITAVLMGVFLLQIRPSSAACVLLPAVDSCNHRGSRPNCEIALAPTDGKFRVTAVRPVPADEEATLCYGPRSNDELLQLFGFVERKNEHDRYVIVNAAAKGEQAQALLQLRTQTPQDPQAEAEAEVFRRFRELHWAEEVGKAGAAGMGAVGAGAAEGPLGGVTTQDAVISADSTCTLSLPAAVLDCLIELEHSLLAEEADTFLAAFSQTAVTGTQGAQGAIGTVGPAGGVLEAERVLRAFFDEKLRLLTQARARIST